MKWRNVLSLVFGAIMAVAATGVVTVFVTFEHEVEVKMPGSPFNTCLKKRLHIILGVWEATLS